LKNINGAAYWSIMPDSRNFSQKNTILITVPNWRKNILDHTDIIINARLNSRVIVFIFSVAPLPESSEITGKRKPTIGLIIRKGSHMSER
jgi:hypothetical protein